MHRYSLPSRDLLSQPRQALYTPVVTFLEVQPHTTRLQPSKRGLCTPTP